MSGRRPVQADDEPSLTQLNSYVGSVIAGGVLIAVLAVVVGQGEGVRPTNAFLAVLFAGCFLAAEFRPLMRFRTGFITVSLAYACALMFVVPGYGAAVLVGLLSIFADLRRGVPVKQSAFNGSMLSLGLAAGTAVLRLGDVQHLDGGSVSILGLLTIALACAVVYTVCSVVVYIVVALVTRRDVVATIRSHFFLTLPTDGVLLPLGPVMVGIGQDHPVLLPLAILLAYGIARVIERSAEAERRANHDALTGLPNRRRFDDEAETALDHAAAHGGAVAVMLVDLDGFKQINDTHGHHVGDAVLQEMATRFVAVLPDEATVSRLGGDEFAILLPEVADVADVEALAMSLTTAVDAPITTDEVDDDIQLSITASIGIAASGPGLETVGSLARAADAAMYIAKAAGLDYSVADNSRQGKFAELASALANDELVLQYQPLINARTEAVTGFEALIRWDHDKRGLIPPSEFMPFLETTPLIAPLTRYVMDHALRHLLKLHGGGYPVGMSVNISVRNLSEPGFAEMVGSLLSTYGLRAEYLTLEITETALMSDADASMETLAALIALGVNVSLDDFGAGHSSLAKLRDFPVNGLKIDRSFLRDADTDRGQRMIRTFIDIADSFDLVVTAEGVEHASTLAFLAQSGCDQAQGFGISRPMGPSESIAWLAGRSSVQRPIYLDPDRAVSS